MGNHKRVLVLGCGRVGATMARDLAATNEFQVRVADFSPAALAKVASRATVDTEQADLSCQDRIRELANGADLVVGALPSVLGYPALRTVIESGKPCCDISFMVEDPRDLHDLAVERGVTAVVDCGVAPGLANIMIAHGVSQLDQTLDVLFYVGGLPKKRRWPYEYKAPFSPSDVIEEYTRPARLKIDGEVVVRPALSEPELVDFPEVGTLEAFNTDGLRSLLDTIPAPTIREKTLRFPGHIELMRVLRETGLFSKETVDVGGAQVRPLDLTSKLLFQHWQLQEDEAEFTLLEVRVKGLRRGVEQELVYRLYDEYNAETGEHSMSRTTGFPCTIVSRMILDGTFQCPGVHPPEVLGGVDGLYERMVHELADRGVTITSQGF